ncbi:MAG: toxin [Desulfobacterales bacterium]|nr:toxin [Desulfobacterales bacterium]
MKIIWDEEKNNLLKSERGICFEDFVRKIEEGRLLDDIKHPNTDKYPNQKVFIVEFDNYTYVIPYIKDIEKDEIMLKTAFPSRKMTKKYIGDKK